MGHERSKDEVTRRAAVWIARARREGPASVQAVAPSPRVSITRSSGWTKARSGAR